MTRLIEGLSWVIRAQLILKPEPYTYLPMGTDGRNTTGPIRARNTAGRGYQTEQCPQVIDCSVSPDSYGD